jgi:hypothetical protein
MATAATPQEEDRRRVCRELRTLVGERVEHANPIKGPLFAQGIFGYELVRVILRGLALDRKTMWSAIMAECSPAPRLRAPE